MERITNTIDNTIYGYDPKEFMPIRVDGELANRNEFIAYKLKRLFGRSRAAAQMLTDGAVKVLQQINDAESY